MSDEPCSRAACTGKIVDGYCDVCGMAPPKTAGRAPAPPSPAPAAPAWSAPPASRRVGTGRPVTQPTEALASVRSPDPGRANPATAPTASRRVDRAFGRGLVERPKVPKVNPRSRLNEDLQIPEHRRYCRRCRQPVGRSRGAGRPGLVEGYCPSCGERYSFRPSLRPGDLVAGQYEVAGNLAIGGLGFVYLAIDRNVADTWVVLKGMQDRDGTADELARAEVAFLAEVEHPNIVKILNFVRHDGDRFIVMEHVNGVSLRSMLDERNPPGEPWNPLPVAESIAYVLEVLPALAHLHEQGLIYCDLKPDNVMATDTSVKLIDLGAVYRLAEPSEQIWGTPGYQAPEIATEGPSPASDVFTVGRTLAVLLADLRGGSTSLPRQDTVPAFAAFDSLYRLLRRATDLDPSARFGSIEELTAQLDGVLHEVVAAQTGTPRPRVSELFTGELAADLDQPSWTSVPGLLVDAADAMAGYLATIGAVDGADVLKLLDRAPAQTTEVALRRAVTLVGLDRGTDADVVLAGIRAEGSGGWRVRWYQGLRWLAAGNGSRAAERFRDVYAAVPGELAPRLALGVAAELAGDPADAAAWYGVVVTTDPSYRAAVFGLARCRAAMGDVRGAANALEVIPKASGAYGAAQVRRVSLLVEAAAAPTGGQPARLLAIRAAEHLPSSEPARDELLARALELELRALRAGATPLPNASVAGEPLDEVGVRRTLETTYRSLAKRASTFDQKVALVDRANRVRPRSLT